MTLDSEIEAEILRLAFIDEWPMGTIASQLGIHRSVVERVISQSQEASITKLARPKFIENHMEFIMDTMKKYPDIHASRLFAMVKKRGYEGRSQSHFRKMIADLRPKKTQEAFARLTTLPGEQAQVDWADFGKVSVGKATHKLMAFVMTLSWSRAVFVRFFFLPRCHFFNKALWMPLNSLVVCQELFYTII
jgi:transposase